MGVGVTCPNCRVNFAFICNKCSSIEAEIHEIFEPVNYFQTRSPYYLKCRTCQAEFDYAVCPECRTKIIPEKPFVTGDRARSALKRCFIASACLGQDNPLLENLYRFRDEVLERFWLGRWFIRLYYIFSPGLAAAMQRNHILRSMIKYVLIYPAWCLALAARKILDR